MVKAAKRKAAARAREGRARARLRASQVPKNLSDLQEAKQQSKPIIIIDLDQTSDVESESEQEADCGYTGGINHAWSDADESEISDTEREEWADEELTDIEEDDLPPVQPLQVTAPVQTIFGKISKQQWKEAEQNRAFGYNGQSKRTQQRNEQKARKAHEEREMAKVS